jgi:hypothetical protein
MTPEQRLDRLERIAKLMVKAGPCSRRQVRDQDQKLAFLIDAQIKNEERFAMLAQSGAQTDRRLDALIDIIRNGRNGKSSN